MKFLMHAKIVSPAEYRTARLNLLAKEKEATAMRDALAAERRKLPAVEVTKPYVFTGRSASGEETRLTLADLFEGRRQLVIYHFMFDPSWDTGCSSCSMLADSIPPLEHLHSRSTSFAVVSRAPIDKIERFKARMGWAFPWVSSEGGSFNYDMHVTQDESVGEVEYNFRRKDELLSKGLDFMTTGEWPGTSVFYRGDGERVGEKGKLYHTYSCYARGGEHLITTLSFLDLTPLGRQDAQSGYEGIGFALRDEYTDKDLKGIQ